MTAMSAMTAAGLYVGLNLLILLVLGVMVMRQRQATKIGVGNGGQKKSSWRCAPMRTEPSGHPRR